MTHQRVEELRAGHAAALGAAERRRDELAAELREAQRLLKASQGALEQTSHQLQSSSADGDAKLRSAMEVASSLRAMLAQGGAQDGRPARAAAGPSLHQLGGQGEGAAWRSSRRRARPRASTRRRWRRRARRRGGRTPRSPR